MNIDVSLKNSEFFSGLSQEHRSEIRESGREIPFGKGERIFSEGDRGESIYLLLQGSVKLYRTAEEGREIIVRILGSGELFGEVILYLNENYPVSSEALEESLLFSVPKKSFHKLMEQELFRNEFIAVLMKKQRYLSGRIHYLSAYDVEERFFQFLLENYGEKEHYVITLSKKDLASAIGTIPETLSRLIGRLKNRGIINWEKKDLHVKEGFWDDYDQPI